MHGRLREVKGSISHLLEHMRSEEIDPPLLTEIYAHMDEVEESLMQFHESVQNTAFNWRRTRPFPETSLGETIPMRLFLPVCIDAFVVVLISDTFLLLCVSYPRTASLSASLAGFLQGRDSFSGSPTAWRWVSWAWRSARGSAGARAPRSSTDTARSLRLPSSCSVPQGETSYSLKALI